MVGEPARLHRARQLQKPPPPTDRGPRRSVTLQGYGLLEDGTRFAISVLDLSYDGCKLESAVALLPNLKLKLSILGISGTLDATVRWSKAGRAGLQFSKGDPAGRRKTPRKHERVDLSAELSVRRAGRQRHQARIFDITPTGCRVEFIERPRCEELLWVKFEGLDSLESVVRWVDGFYGGLEFVRPIHPAVFDLLLLRLRS